MKSFAICAVLGGLVFGAAVGMQTGVFSAGRLGAIGEQMVEHKSITPRLRFPADLAKAAQAKAVPQAAEFKPGPDPHKLVVLRPDGTLHPWNENVKDEWQASSVEGTELVLVVGKQKKVFVDRTDYPNGAPPIWRYIFQVEVSVVEPRTGKVLANKWFKNMPRPVRRVEAWETTALGQPVRLPVVFNWVASNTQIGFPEEYDPTPIVNTAAD